MILSLMNMQAPSEAVTNSPAGHQVLRTATHNILYTSANSIGQEVSVIPVPYWLYITVAVVDAGLIALCVFYFVRRRKNVKRWKERILCRLNMEEQNGVLESICSQTP